MPVISVEHYDRQCPKVTAYLVIAKLIKAVLQFKD